MYILKPLDKMDTVFRKPLTQSPTNSHFKFRSNHNNNRKKEGERSNPWPQPQILAHDMVLGQIPRLDQTNPPVLVIVFFFFHHTLADACFNS